jgi:hypothetical protein
MRPRNALASTKQKFYEYGITSKLREQFLEGKPPTPVTATKRIRPEMNTVERYSGPVCDALERCTRTEVDVR